MGIRSDEKRLRDELRASELGVWPVRPLYVCHNQYDGPVTGARMSTMRHEDRMPGPVVRVVASVDYLIERLASKLAAFSIAGGRCVACDKRLSRDELDIRGFASGEPLALCGVCSSTVNTPDLSREVDGRLDRQEPGPADER